VGKEPAIDGGEKHRWCEKEKWKEVWTPLLRREERSKKRNPRKKEMGN
jgi:hypothetical protein